MFARGAALDDVTAATGRAPSTVAEYLAEYIEAKRPWNIDPWVEGTQYERVANAARRLGDGRLKPIFEHLNREVPYAVIRLVVSHQAAMRPGATGASRTPL